MLSILKTLSFFSGSRGPHGPDLPSPCGRKFYFSLHLVQLVTAIITAVYKAIPKSKSERSESNPISDETIVLIKEKRRRRRQYSQNKDQAVMTRINKLQKQIKDELRVEMQASWKKFCNSISLETDPSESWRKIRNFLKPKDHHDYPTLHHDEKVAKTNADKPQFFAESVEKHFGIEREHFDWNHFN